MMEARLVQHLEGGGVVGDDLNGDPGNSGIVGGADGQGLNVVALAGKEPGDLGQDARGVFHQHRKGAAAGFFSHLLHLLIPG